MTYVSEQARLAAAFETVCNPNDWRAPIEAWIEATDVDRIDEAVIHFTATRIEVVGYGVLVGRPGEVLIRAVGYRNGPAGP